MSKFFSNKDIARLLREISAGYQARGENRFKIIAYDNAAASVEHATRELKDLWEDGQLETVPGLGKSIRKHLDELFSTGKVKHFEEVKKSLPQGMFSLLEIGGLGPKSAYKLAKELNLKSIDDLKKAAENKKIRKIPGFGQKSENIILTAIAELKGRVTNRYLITEAFPVAERVLGYLRSHKDCERAEPLGSLRRMVATVGDIDIAVASQNPREIIEHLKKFKEVKRILDAGPRKSSLLLLNGMQVDLIVQPKRAFGALLQHFTGSKNHIIKLREYALKKGYSVSDYGIKVKGKIKEFAREDDFYNFLGMDFIIPEIREDTGEIEAALTHKLPLVVDVGDIKGDIHLHSSYPIEPSHDLGTGSFADILEKAKTLKYQYVGLSDHSPGYSTHTKAEIINLIKKRSAKIEQLKNSNKDLGILNLLEIDILKDGILSVPEEGLKLLDGSIAGIHSSHSQDRKTITTRILNAVNNPYVQVISHPTNRLLMHRESSDIDWPQVFEACKKTGTILEINASPNRLDLPDSLIREALKFGVKFVINTDSHAVSQMDNMLFGVGIARRGWAEKNDIVNTLHWKEFKKLFNTND